eukprot:CAMPEP_0180605716 /NCGR_PEP_ID=MMETSP1037_2-20121125/26762_1 /TAXON_ID=632150 /ORGANISM="Azadinium spinosum, Strain 3D9" /LENGTH=109 /DNA_ID=CAMNT_0022624841 /DNA_START=102 /DNA_END=432 /DNA_ORIENTATION=-
MTGCDSVHHKLCVVRGGTEDVDFGHSAAGGTFVDAQQIVVALHGEVPLGTGTIGVMTGCGGVQRELLYFEAALRMCTSVIPLPEGPLLMHNKSPLPFTAKAHSAPAPLV